MSREKGFDYFPGLKGSHCRILYKGIVHSDFYLKIENSLQMGKGKKRLITRLLKEVRVLLI